MNSAQRLLKFATQVNASKNYTKTMGGMLKNQDNFINLYYYKYLLLDIKNIQTIIEKKGKLKGIHKARLTQIMMYVSPNQQPAYYTAPLFNSIKEGLEFLELALDDEKPCQSDIDNIKKAMEGLKPTGTILDEIMKDIDEITNYYAVFGEPFVEEKIHRILGVTLINKEKIIEATKKYEKTIKVILMMYDAYKEMKEIQEDGIDLLESIQKQIEAPKEEE